MNERDATRAQSEAVHQAGRETGGEQPASRMDRTLRCYLAGAYYAVRARSTDRRRDDGEARDP